MRMRLFVLLMLITPMIAAAQQPEYLKDPFIEVTGTAHQEIEPNEIYTIIRLREFEENREKVSLEKLEKDFLNAIKEAGIDRKRLELADAGSKIGKLGRRDKDAFREKTYQIKLTSAAELEKFVEKLQPVKVDYVDITKLSHSDLEKIKMDLKVKALQAAKAKAEYLLKSIGSEVGKPLMVRDWDMDPVEPVMEYRANVMMKAQNAGADMAQEEPQVGFRKIKLQTQVMAQFEIK